MRAHSYGVEEVDAEAVQRLLGLDVELEQFAGPDEHPHRDQHQAAGALTGAPVTPALVIQADHEKGHQHRQAPNEEHDRPAKPTPLRL